MKPQLEKALGRYLNIRERSRMEVASYLKRGQVEPQEIETLLDRFEELGVINDQRFIEFVIRGYLHKGKGQLYIRHKLMQAGIARSEIDKAVKGISLQDLQSAMEAKLARGLGRASNKTAGTERQRAISLLSSSGFLLETILSFIDDWAQKE